MERQTVLKTAGGNTLTGSTPVPSAKSPVRTMNKFYNRKVTWHKRHDKQQHSHGDRYVMPKNGTESVRIEAKEVKRLDRGDANGER